MQAYIDPARASDPHYLPDLSIQHMEHPEADTLRHIYWEAKAACAMRLAGDISGALATEESVSRMLRLMSDASAGEEFEQAAQDDDDMPAIPAGFYHSVCLPGCMPDSDWSGPFDTAEEAIADARRTYGEA